jgi:hydroxymethylpyrimidine pyrophosphatase-like HAD family hydrolase
VTIAIDYDGTLKCSSGYDPDECKMWSTIITTFQSAGHKVVICTNRTGSVADAQDIGRYLAMAGIDIPVVFAGERGYKSDVCREDGYSVDLWIEDMPEMVRKPYLLQVAEDE